MASVRETALAGLAAELKQTLLGTVRRDDGSDGTIPKAGTGALVTVQDGSPDGTAIMSPLCYAITHEVPVIIDAYSRADMDNAMQGVASVVTANPTLGGVVEWTSISSSDASVYQPEGKEGFSEPRIFTASLGVTLTYTAPTIAG